jgi:DNA-binding transcriptional regulator YdaS (Cro superfamily)
MDELKSYIRDPDRARQLAEAVGTKPVWLRHVAWGHGKLSARMAKNIERATDGQIAAHRLRPDIFDPPVNREVSP